MRQMTSKDILDYSTKRAVQAGVTGPFAWLAEAWRTAAVQFNAGNPDEMIRLLRQDLKLEEEAASHFSPHETCSGPERARGEAAKRARVVVALLWRIAEEYGPARVWGDELETRQAEARMEVGSSQQTPAEGKTQERQRIEEAIRTCMLPHTCLRGYMTEITNSEALVQALAETFQRMLADEVRAGLAAADKPGGK